MKKFKRFLAAITTVAVSAVSLCSMFTASADTTQLKTFRIFHEVTANSDIAFFRLCDKLWFNNYCYTKY